MWNVGIEEGGKIVGLRWARELGWTARELQGHCERIVRGQDVICSNPF